MFGLTTDRLWNLCYNSNRSTTEENMTTFMTDALIIIGAVVVICGIAYLFKEVDFIS